MHERPTPWTGHFNARAGSASSAGSACRLTTWSLKGVVGTLDMYPGLGLRMTGELASPNCRNASLTKNAVRSAVLRDTILISTHCKGSKCALCRTVKTRERSQEGMRRGRGGFNLLALLMNLMIKSSFPRDLPCTASWIAATYNFKQPTLQPALQEREHVNGRKNTNQWRGATSKHRHFVEGALAQWL